jgi:Ca2+-binding RTX toxin-like protein
VLGTVVLIAAVGAIGVPAALAKPGDLYIAGNETAAKADVVRMDPKTGAVQDVATLPGNGQGDNAAFGANGLLYIADESNDVVYAVNVSTGATTTISFATFDQPWALDVAPNGRVLVGDYSAETLFRITPLSGNVIPFSTGGILTRLNALAAAPSGRIFVALGPDTGSMIAQVLSVDPVSGAQQVVGDLPGDGNTDYPQGATVTPNGKTVYVGREASIDRFLPGSGAVSEVSSDPAFTNLFDLELGFDGQLYVVENDSHLIHRVNPQTGARTTVGDSTEEDPIGIAVQPPRCGGKTATIVGTQKRDKIKGSPGPDVIAGLRGADTIRGLKGNDRLCGGKGPDTLIGGKGFDRLRGGPGADIQRQA